MKVYEIQEHGRLLAGAGSDPDRFTYMPSIGTGK